MKDMWCGLSSVLTTLQNGSAKTGALHWGEDTCEVNNGYTRTESIKVNFK